MLRAGSVLHEPLRMRHRDRDGSTTPSDSDGGHAPVELRAGGVLHRPLRLPPLAGGDGEVATERDERPRVVETPVGDRPVTAPRARAMSREVC